MILYFKLYLPYSIGEGGIPALALWGELTIHGSTLRDKIDNGLLVTYTHNLVENSVSHARPHGGGTHEQSEQ